MFKHLLLLGMCAALAACATTPQNAERDVAQASDEFFAARQRGDVSSFVVHFTEDGTFMVPGLTDAAGHDAIRQLAQKRFAGGATEDFKVHRREIRFADDAAYELGWFSETDRRPGQAFQMAGRHVIVWKRGGDGRWRVQRYLYSFSDARPAP